VHERPDGINDADLAAILAQHWALAGASLEYLPVGFGGFHWLATDRAGEQWFVTLTDLTGMYGADLVQSMETAADLAAAGLEFVVTAVRSAAGPVVVRLGAGLGITVRRYIRCRPGQWDDVLSAAERLAVIEMLARLHAASVPAAAPVRSLPLGRRYMLSAALAELDSRWTSGPFAEPARVLLAERRPDLLAALSRFDELARELASSGGPVVLTHGEPHPGNLLHAAAGPLLIDWDTVGIAWPERDLWSLLGADGQEAAAYTQLTGRAVNPEAVELYRLRWPLDDMCMFLEEIRAPHQRDADTETSFAGLTESLDALRHIG
jgi:spectinomycin phosphotransferase